MHLFFRILLLMLSWRSRQELRKSQYTQVHPSLCYFWLLRRLRTDHHTNHLVKRRNEDQWCLNSCYKLRTTSSFCREKRLVWSQNGWTDFAQTQFWSGASTSAGTQKSPNSKMTNRYSVRGSRDTSNSRNRTNDANLPRYTRPKEALSWSTDHAMVTD